MNILLQHPVFSMLLTVIFYMIGMVLHQRWRWIPPIVAACIPIIVALLLIHEPWAVYNRGGNLFTWMLGPATVGLAVPMFRNGQALRGSLPRLALIVLIGSIVGMVTAGGTAWLLGGTATFAGAILQRWQSGNLRSYAAWLAAGAAAVLLFVVVPWATVLAGFGIHLTMAGH